ncbi:hypothetical protein [Staphylococcus agnetis]|uniref:hypothetical protein n=1 Tax=Staphylococcus agnetis TaxID=985762 RepID=UPI0039EA676E
MGEIKNQLEEIRNTIEIALFPEQIWIFKQIIAFVTAPNALDHKDKRMDKLDKEEDGFLDKISSSQMQFLNDFEAYAKGAWVDAAKREMETIKKDLETIK